LLLVDSKNCLSKQVMADYSGLSKGMKLQVESGGTYYAAEVMQVKKGGKAPVKVRFVGYDAQYDEFVGADRIKSKAVKAAAKDAPKAKESGGGKGSVRTGKDGGAGVLGKMDSYASCVLAEYIWLDAHQVPRSKTKVMTARPTKVSDLPIWNYDGSSTEQAEGHNSEINIKPRAFFHDPFRGYPHVMVLTDCYNAWDDQPSIGNTRAACAEVHAKYKKHDAWYGLEQEYTLMKPGKVGVAPTQPLGFNADGSEPAPQGPYYTGAGTGIAIGRPVADEHLAKCLAAGVKIAGINAEVMPGQWEYQIGPCRGVEIGDHMAVARYIMYRVTESHNCVVSFSPKPKDGDWNGAGCHTNFSIKSMREKGGYDVITKVCEAFGKKTKEHIAEYGEGNDKRLTGKHETCSINEFKFGVANRGASIRIPRDAEKNGRGYMEDRRPAANCDAYRVAARIMLTTGECLE
jgi:glutamine synthetase